MAAATTTLVTAFFALLKTRFGDTFFVDFFRPFLLALLLTFLLSFLLPTEDLDFFAAERLLVFFAAISFPPDVLSLPIAESDRPNSTAFSFFASCRCPCAAFLCRSFLA